MKNRESGYTLVELLITIAITGLIFVIAGSAIYQLSTVSGYGNTRLTEVHELQNAAHWLNRDGQEAISATGGTGLNLTWPDGSQVSYSTNGTNLQRVSGSSIMTLAQDVTGLSFTVQNNLVTMNITTQVSGRWGENVQGTYQVYLRPRS